MTTDAIEEKLRNLGVRHTRERFIELAEGRESAWSIGQSWLETAPVRRNDDVDFLGLAACELWKRLLPRRPSVEMIDDWMQEGYEHDAAGRRAEATRIWWKVWQTLRSRFSPVIRTMDAARAVFSGTQVIFNWCQDFELCLSNAVVTDSPELAGLGKQYCTEWLAQFPDEDGGTQVNFLRALARFQFCLGETSAGEATLQGIIERWPEDVWGYVALADAYGHFWSGEPGPERDVPRALGYLERGLAMGSEHRDRPVLLERRDELLRRAAE